MFSLQICRYSMGNLMTEILKVVEKYKNFFCDKGSGEALARHVMKKIACVPGICHI